jgi:hypothetical protein
MQLWPQVSGLCTPLQGLAVTNVFSTSGILKLGGAGSLPVGLRLPKSFTPRLSLLA